LVAENTSWRSTVVVEIALKQRLGEWLYQA
jgi:hypothetical protein